MQRMRILKDQTIGLKLTAKEKADLQEKAEAKAEHYNNLLGSAAPYKQNHANSHMVGMAAEYGTHQVFEDLANIMWEKQGLQWTIDPVYNDDKRDKECDLIVNGLRIEIKALTWKNIEAFGFCVADKQAKNIAKKADVIVWVCYNHFHGSIQVQGFTKVSDIANVPVEMTGPEGRLVANHVMTEYVKPLIQLQF